MNVKRWIIGAVIGFLLGAAQSWAVGGVRVDNSDPHFATQDNKRDFEDMRVKVMGGSVYMARRWVGDQWEWNTRWNDLEVEGQYSTETAPVGSGSISTDGDGSGGVTVSPFPAYVARNGQVYIKGQAAIAEGEQIYENGLLRTLTRGSDGDWLWKDRRGNRIHYNRYGQMTHYWDRNGVTVRVNRNAAGNITEIEDHHGQIVITITWEDIPGADPVTNKQGDEVAPQRPTQMEDYSGRTVMYNWNAGDELDTVTDVRGEEWSYQYSGGSLVSHTDPEGRVTKVDIDSKGELRSVFNADGVGGRYSYNYDSGKEEYYVASTDGSGRTVESWFNNHGMEIRRDLNGETQFTSEVVLSDNSLGTDNMVKRYAKTSSGASSGGSSTKLSAPPPPVYVKTETVTDGRGNKTVYEYDMWKNVLSVKHPDGASISASYNVEYSLPRIVTNERGIITEYFYDAKGNLETLIEAKGSANERTTRYTYDQFGQRRTMTTGESAAGDTDLATTEWRYDSYGNVVKIIDPLLDEIDFSNIDVLGNPWTVTDARDKVWQFSFDAAGNLLSERNPYDQGEIYTYTKAGDLDTLTEANSATTSIDTNASGLPTTVTDAASQVTTLEFDKANRLTGIIDANEHSAYLTYDSQARIASFTDGENNVTEFNYVDTLLDNIEYPTFRESFNYDKRNRIVDSTQQANSRTYLRRFGYDLVDNVNSSTDANNLEESYDYDELNRLVSHTDAEGGITEFRYDARDNLVRVIDPEQRITAYTYTLRGELETETKQDDIGTARHYRYTYDPNGNLASSRTPAQERTEYDYDDANRLAETRLYAQAGDPNPIKITSYHYNNSNQYEGYSQAAGAGPGPGATTPTPDILSLAETYTYNSLNQLKSVTADFGAFQKTYSYTYYPNGLKRSYTNPENITYTYYYTKHDELAAVQIPGEGQIGLTSFNWLVPQTILLPGGSKVTLTYDQFLQVEERLLSDPADTELARAIYQYGLENNITQISESYGSLVFDYDNLYRLTDADYPWDNSPNLANNEGFAYDGVGNRIEHGPGSDSQLSEADQAAATATLDYDNHNRLEGSTDGASFAYNANGHTRQKVHNGQTTDYIYNRQERLIEVRVDGATVGEYSYNPYGQRVRKTANGQTTWFLYNDEGLAAEYDNSGNLIKEYHFKPYSPWMTAPLMQRTASGQVYYYQNDHLGTPQRMVDKSGAVVWEARYEAFGKAEVLTASVENNLRFPGQYFDSETGLHHNYFRDYDTSIGRYLQSDPIGLNGGINTYFYASSNPLIRIDPDGRLWAQVGGAVFGVAFGIYNALQDPCWTPESVAYAALIGGVVGVASTVGAGPWAAAVISGGSAAAGNAVQQTIVNGEVNWGEVATAGVWGAAGGAVGSSVGRAIAPKRIVDPGIPKSAAAPNRPGKTQRMLERDPTFAPDQDVVNALVLGSGVGANTGYAATATNNQNECEC